MGKLTVTKVRSLSNPGRYGDGGTLFLNVAPGGSKSWVQRLTVDGMRRDIGLGGFPLVTLAEARDKALDNRRLARRGGDPLAAKRKKKVPTFRQAAQATFDANKARWRNGKHTRNWMQTLEKRAFPVIGDKPVDRVRPEDVLRIVSPIWSKHADVARKLRQRIKATLAWAQAHGYVEHNAAGEGIDGALPTMPAVQSNFRALHHTELSEALRIVEASRSSLAVKLCFQWVVLTCARSSEARLATWDEIQEDERLWVVPPSRMKIGTEHRQPLSDAAMTVLDRARALRDESDLLFPSPARPGKPMSDMTLVKCTRDVGLAEKTTIHGLRATFRTWASERTTADHATMELCLAHRVGSAVEQAYARSDLLAKRRRLMQTWGQFATGGDSAKVIPLRVG